MLNSLQKNDDIGKQGLNETANNVNNFQEAMPIINCCQDITNTQNKKSIEYIGKQGKQGQLLKIFKYFDNVGQSRSTIYFKTSLYKIMKKYSLVKKYTLQ